MFNPITWLIRQVEHIVTNVLLDRDLHFLGCNCEDARMEVTP